MRGTLRAYAEFNDSQMHGAISCASRSCPDLRSVAYRGKGLRAAFAEQFRTFTNDSQRGMRDTLFEAVVKEAVREKT